MDFNEIWYVNRSKCGSIYTWSMEIQLDPDGKLHWIAISVKLSNITVQLNILLQTIFKEN